MLGWNDKYAENCFPKDKLAQVKTFDFVVGVGGNLSRTQEREDSG